MNTLSNLAAGSVLFMIGALSAILIVLVVLSARDPVLAKIGLRNLVRRPTQAVLIVLGLTLSTIIIISAFGTGDTLSYSVRRQAVAAYGEVDEIIGPSLIAHARQHRRRRRGHGRSRSHRRRPHQRGARHRAGAGARRPAQH